MSCAQVRKKLLRLSEVTTILPVSYQRLAELARRGILPTVRLGRQIFVDPARLAEFIAAGGKALPGGWRRESRVQRSLGSADEVPDENSGSENTRSTLNQ